MSRLDDLVIEGYEPLTSPIDLKRDVPVSNNAARTVESGRAMVKAILDGTDPRMLAIVGPCSIHDPVAALEYAGRLKQAADHVKDTLAVVMRVYFEKPRTTVGWKGMINDPYLDDSCKIEDGLRIARKLLVDINELGMPAGTEALDPIAPQYTGDLISWYAIGARTTESQTHRELASGLSAPVGFKNSTDGNVKVAIDGIRAAAKPHYFGGINPLGRVSRVATKGNAYGHVILRGSNGHTNYDDKSVRSVHEALVDVGIYRGIIIDCSHSNSSKNPEKQPAVLDTLVEHKRNGLPIAGFMMESNLFGGAQKVLPDHAKMQYGVSITDACLGWESTARALFSAHEKLKPRRI